ncbi:hypothetical protein J3R83DRAFT_13946 [Lanmaoa asiatica]|nr:hypothetical protein J3R83DRAFT_13946 [Lanmaoa asiatica]
MYATDCLIGIDGSSKTVREVYDIATLHDRGAEQEAQTGPSQRTIETKHLAASAQVQITRRKDDFPDDFSRVPRPFTTLHASGHLEMEEASGGSSSLHSVALALGSSLGYRFANPQHRDRGL